MSFWCTICTDIFVSTVDIHVTPCGHAFHYACILQWLERSKSCPECRNKFIAKDLTKVYLNHVTNLHKPSGSATPLDNINPSSRENETPPKSIDKPQDAHKVERNKMRRLLGTIEGQRCVISTLRYEVLRLRAEQTEHKRIKEDMEKLESQMRLVNTLKYVIDSTIKETEELVASNSNPHTLAVLATSLKRELQASEFKRNELRDQIKSCQSKLHSEKNKCKDLADKLATADSEMYRLQSEVEALRKETADSDTISDTNRILDTPVNDQVCKILQSDSPYLQIESCAFGLQPAVFWKGRKAAFGKNEPSAKRRLALTNEGVQ